MPIPKSKLMKRLSDWYRSLGLVHCGLEVTPEKKKILEAENPKPQITEAFKKEWSKDNE